MTGRAGTIRVNAHRPLRLMVPFGGGRRIGRRTGSRTGHGISHGIGDAHGQSAIDE
jgi:hypothetical protein